MMAVCVDPAQIEQFWPHFKHWIEDAIHRIGLTPFDYVEREVLAGRMLLWLAYDGAKVQAAATTELNDGVCTIVAGGGGLDAMLSCIPMIESFARDEKCRSTRIIGRRGWMRVLPEYKAKAAILERPL